MFFISFPCAFCLNLLVTSTVMSVRILHAIFHRSRAVEHQCSRGGAGRRGRCCLFQLDFERDLILVRDNIIVLIFCGFSCLTDGLHTRNTGDIICAGIIRSFSPLAILANRTVFHVATRRCLFRQHVQRQ